MPSSTPHHVLRFANHANVPFKGWKRTTSDVFLPHKQGTINGTPYVVSETSGNVHLKVLDVFLDLEAGERLELPIRSAQAEQVVGTNEMVSIRKFFGGPLKCNGEPMLLMGARVDGAAITAHLRWPVGAAFTVDAWLRWYPGQPWVEAEIAVTSSVAGKLVNSPTKDIELTWGAGHMHHTDGRVSSVVFHEEDSLADGQSRVFPATFVFPTQSKDWRSMAAVASMGVGACGIRSLWGNGDHTPIFPADFDALEWAGRELRHISDRMETWQLHRLGPTANSTQTGAQEEQLFHAGGEAMLEPGAEWPSYLSSLKIHGERPTHFKRPSGEDIDPSQLPGCHLWDGRPLAAISSDTLGRARPLEIHESRGRWGPDTQHFLARRLGTAAKIMGTEACQWLLRNLATVYLGQRSADRNVSTSATFSAREWGYEGLFVLQVLDVLWDRGLAHRVLTRWRNRVHNILVPEMEGQEHLHVFLNDPRLGQGAWVIGWQEALGAYGIMAACAQFGPHEGTQVALRVAKSVLAKGWTVGLEGWRSRAQYPVDGQVPPASNDRFNDFGMPLAAATVLWSEPHNERAKNIWQDLKRQGSWKWMPQEVDWILEEHSPAEGERV